MVNTPPKNTVKCEKGLNQNNVSGFWAYIEEIPTTRVWGGRCG